MNQKNRIASGRYLALALCLLPALPGCSRSNDDGSLMVLHYYQKDDMKSVDPANAYDSISLEILPNIYETLYQYDYLAEGYRLVPLLAADLPKISANHLDYTIPIRRDVKFHQGRELKAQDFIYAWKRLALPSLQSSGWWLLDGKIVGINAFHERLLSATKSDIGKVMDEKVDGMYASDDYTIKIRLTKPYPQLMYALAMTFTAPMAKEWVEKHSDEKGNVLDGAMGTGAFALTQWSRGSTIILDRSPDTIRNSIRPRVRSSSAPAD